MFDLSEGASKPLLYEDIVVAAFKRFPSDFQLRGYPQYPDASDIHKPLYKMKRDGLIRSANKSFLLTEAGLELARSLSKPSSVTSDRLTKTEEGEIQRILKSEAFHLYNSGRSSQILDTDFYDCVGASVRTPNAEFSGRLATMRAAVIANERRAHSDPQAKIIAEFHAWLIQQFHHEIQARS